MKKEESAFSYLGTVNPDGIARTSPEAQGIMPVPGQASMGPAMPPSPFTPREMRTGAQIFGQPIPNSFDRQMPSIEEQQNDIQQF
tara:strand:+ start:884 stop:1138 length:255 start_codon:yes stop_codon:yes gene_type:complete